jgi:hypothetical protein
LNHFLFIWQFLLLSTLRGKNTKKAKMNKNDLKLNVNKTPSFGQAPQCPLESLNEGWVAGARSADSP